MLMLSSQSGAAMAQVVVGPAGPSPATPSASPNYRVALSVVPPDTSAARPRSSLDRLFVARDGFGKANHRHTALLGFGGVEIMAEALRERAGIAPGSIWRGVHALDRFSAAGITAGWSPGENDGAHLQMSLAWRADRGASAGGINRIVELAQGAALREQGVRLTLSYLMSGATASRGTTLGIAARDARIAGGDLAAIGPAARQDMQTALFVRTAF